MRLVCPECAALYEVPSDMIPPEGRDVQCSACGNNWFQEKTNEEDEFSGENDNQDLGTPELEGVVDHATAQSKPELATTQEGVPSENNGLTQNRRSLDPDVAKVLREEAQREMQARQRTKETFEPQGSIDFLAQDDVSGQSQSAERIAPSGQDEPQEKPWGEEHATKAQNDQETSVTAASPNSPKSRARGLGNNMENTTSTEMEQQSVLHQPQDLDAEAEPPLPVDRRAQIANKQITAPDVETTYDEAEPRNTLEIPKVDAQKDAAASWDTDAKEPYIEGDMDDPEKTIEMGADRVSYGAEDSQPVTIEFDEPAPIATAKQEANPETEPVRISRTTSDIQGFQRRVRPRNVTEISSSDDFINSKDEEPAREQPAEIRATKTERINQLPSIDDTTDAWGIVDETQQRAEDVQKYLKMRARRMGSNLGFGLMIFLCVIAAGFYWKANEIVLRLPQAAPYVESYVEAADNARAVVNQQVALAVKSITQLSGR